MNQYTRSNIPVYLKPVISMNVRSKSSDVIKELFKKCPICGKFSFKPNYNVNLIPPNAMIVYSIAAMKGRKCRQCNFISEPTIKKDVGPKTAISL